MAVTSAVVSVVAMVASTAMSVVSSVQQQQAAQRQAQAQKEAAQRQAEAARLQGRLSEANAGLEAANIQKESQRARSAQVAAGAGAGMNLESSSLLDIMDETQSLYEADRQQLLRTGQLQKGAATYSATGYDQAADYYGGFQPSYWGAAAQGFAGIGSAASSFYSFYADPSTGTAAS